jgi:hypothetical protein
MRKLLLVTVLLAIPALASAQMTWYDTYGFEAGVDPTAATADFTLGALNGQGDWPQATGPWVGSSGGGGVQPMIVSPDPGGAVNQCVQLYVGDDQNDYSEMDIAINDPLAAGYRVVTVSFDIYRTNPTGPVHNLWWWWFDAGDPTYGLQWDQGPSTLPFGWNTGAGSTATVFDQWANVTMTWDFTNNTTSSWYNGVPVDVAIPMPGNIATLTGWSIELGHDSATGTGTDTAWIDNFTITVDHLVPEPSVWLLAGLGLLALMRRKKK